MATIKLVRPKSESEKHTRTTVDTMELTPNLVAAWKLPPFQRRLKINNKVLAVAEKIKADRGVLPGILTLGVLDGDIYVVDGQHRIHAFTLADLSYGYADVRTVFFGDMAEMADEYEELNSQLVRMQPDDKLRAMELSNVTLQRLRKKCPFIGYDNVRRDSKNSPVLSMSTFIRTWTGSRNDTPNQGLTCRDAVLSMNEKDTDDSIEFAQLAFSVWQRDHEFFRLWGAANLSICMWLYRRMVLSEGTSKTSRWSKLSRDQFRKALMSLSADGVYLDYLVGRTLGDRDRPPTYSRVKAVFHKRLKEETDTKLMFPQPAWAKNT